MEFRFPEGFSLGVSSAATQIEGGDTRHSWNDWYDKGRIKDGSDPAASCHWDCWQADTALMASLGIRDCRFGVEWSRLIPRRGEVDEAAVAHYRQEISCMRQAGIRPLLTIHHFTNPLWFEEKGAFLKWENLEDYLDLVRLVVSRFGDLVSDYITINEPNVYAVGGYFGGGWPPGQRSMTRTLRVMEHLAYCHIRAYEIIHQMRRELGFADTRVSFANHMRVFAPKDPRNPCHRLCADVGRYLFQGALSSAMMLGDFRWPLHNRGHLPRGAYADFLGVNYYARSTVSGLSDGVRDNSPRNDLGWEIYPEGLVTCARELLDVLERPVWVTENGACDNTDRFRSRYICEHLKAMADSGLPFERYYHWCFFDNFEWLEGFSARFGLVQADGGTPVRTVKRSGELYARMIREGGLSGAAWEEFAAGQEYTVR